MTRNFFTKFKPIRILKDFKDLGINLDITKGKFLPDPSSKKDRDTFLELDELKLAVISFVFGGGAGAGAEGGGIEIAEVFEEAEILPQELLDMLEDPALNDIIVTAGDEEIFQGIIEEMEELGEFGENIEIREILTDVSGGVGDLGTTVGNLAKLGDVVGSITEGVKEGKKIAKDVGKFVDDVGDFLSNLNPFDKHKPIPPRRPTIPVEPDEPVEPISPIIPPAPPMEVVTIQQAEDIYQRQVLNKELQALEKIEEREVDLFGRVATILDPPVNVNDFIKDLSEFISKEAKEQYLEENFTSFTNLNSNEINQVLQVLG